jgi:hypothetical protein
MSAELCLPKMVGKSPPPILHEYTAMQIAILFPIVYIYGS